MLYPKMTKSRMVFQLNGIWDFKLLKEEDSFNPLESSALEGWMAMPVPSSYNDIYQGREFADHVGDMVYQRTFAVTETMKAHRLVLRFGSVAHVAQVYLNGKKLGSHKGGFLPFSFDITNEAVAGENVLTVVVSNIVDNTTLPCGRLVKEEFPGLPSRLRNLPNFDFYNYTGILRPVWLYTTPDTYIKDITVMGKMDGQVFWEAAVSGQAADCSQVSVEVLDKDGKTVCCGEGKKGVINAGKINLWSPENPYLYSLNVKVRDEQGIFDEYTETFGFREIGVKNCRLTLNGDPIYLKGFGKHEECPVHGRATDLSYIVKDLGLLKWIGANSFRTSHYPNSEEMMQMCDREGILVIDETPAVGLHTGFTATGLLGGVPNGTWKTMETAEHHQDVIRDMIQRDKNHPCVIAWSAANEPASEEEGAKEYFEPLVEQFKTQDLQHRPVTIVTYEGSSPKACKVAELCDFLVLNRYRGWYDTEGNLEGAKAKLKDELERFHKRCPNKPIMLGEYGADTIAGIHDINGRLFSEEYQVQFMEAYSQVFDSLSYITGEHVWVFADFATAENIKRVEGNKKGIFTRDRQPKMAAYYLRRRWKEKFHGQMD